MTSAPGSPCCTPGTAAHPTRRGQSHSGNGARIERVGSLERRVHSGEYADAFCGARLRRLDTHCRVHRLRPTPIESRSDVGVQLAQGIYLSSLRGFADTTMAVRRCGRSAIPGAPFFFVVPHAGRIRFGSNSFRSSLTLPSSLLKRTSNPIRSDWISALDSSSAATLSSAIQICRPFSRVDVRHQSQLTRQLVTRKTAKSTHTRPRRRRTPSLWSVADVFDGRATSKSSARMCLAAMSESVVLPRASVSRTKLPGLACPGLDPTAQLRR